MLYDRTWSRSNSEGGWPETSSVADDGKEWPNTSQANSQAFTDLVPEFEPGKPWKVGLINTIMGHLSLE